MHLEVVTELDRLEQRREEWNELFNRAPDLTPFQSASWLLPWVRTFTKGSSLHEHRLARLGRVQWDVAGEDDWEEVLEALFVLHRARWRSKGQVGILGDDQVRSFHFNATRALIRSHQLRLMSLRLDGRIVGVIHVLQGRCAYQYASGFEPRLAHASPGSLLIAGAIADAIALGKRE